MAINNVHTVDQNHLHRTSISFWVRTQAECSSAQISYVTETVCRGFPHRKASSRVRRSLGVVVPGVLFLCDNGVPWLLSDLFAEQHIGNSLSVIFSSLQETAIAVAIVALF